MDKSLNSCIDVTVSFGIFACNTVKHKFDNKLKPECDPANELLSADRVAELLRKWRRRSTD